jgi:hypothetical protein
MGYSVRTWCISLVLATGMACKVEAQDTLPGLKIGAWEYASEVTGQSVPGVDAQTARQAALAALKDPVKRHCIQAADTIAMSRQLGEGLPAGLKCESLRIAQQGDSIQWDSECYLAGRAVRSRSTYRASSDSEFLIKSNQNVQTPRGVATLEFSIVGRYVGVDCTSNRAPTSDMLIAASRTYAQSLAEKEEHNPFASRRAPAGE